MLDLSLQEAEGLALEMHRQNVELKHVVRRLKQKLTTMEVRLYKVVDEDEATTSAPIMTKEDSSGTFGILKLFFALSEHLCISLVFLCRPHWTSSTTVQECEAFSEKRFLVAIRACWVEVLMEAAVLELCLRSRVLFQGIPVNSRRHPLRDGEQFFLRVRFLLFARSP
jgi:hypothetical protein